MMQPPMMVSNGNGTAPFISGRSSYIFGGLVNVVLCWIFPGAGNVIAAVADPWRRVLHLVCGFLMVGCMWLLGWTIIGYIIPLVASLVYGLMMILNADRYGNYPPMSFGGPAVTVVTTGVAQPAYGSAAPQSQPQKY